MGRNGTQWDGMGQEGKIWTSEGPTFQVQRKLVACDQVAQADDFGDSDFAGYQAG